MIVGGEKLMRRNGLSKVRTFVQLGLFQVCLIVFAKQMSLIKYKKKYSRVSADSLDSKTY